MDPFLETQKYIFKIFFSGYSVQWKFNKCTKKGENQFIFSHYKDKNRAPFDKYSLIFDFSSKVETFPKTKTYFGLLSSSGPGPRSGPDRVQSRFKSCPGQVFSGLVKVLFIFNSLELDSKVGRIVES